MSRRLSQREKRLLFIVATVVFVCGNFILLDWARSTYTRLQGSIASQKKQLRMIGSLRAETDFWEKRHAWLDSHQPKLDNAEKATGELLDEVKALAAKHGLLLERPVFRPAERQPEYVSISIEIETKSAWNPLVLFLRDLQSSAQFIAVESANLKADAADQTQMRGRFRIARWYAPR